MALGKLEKVLWRDVGAKPSIVGLTSFLAEFPEGAHAREARARVEALQKAEAEEHASRAREQKELVAWNAVRETIDPDTLQAFLKEWPDSPHKAEALRLRKSLAGGFFTRRTAGDTLHLRLPLQRPPLPSWEYAPPENLTQSQAKSCLTKVAAISMQRSCRGLLALSAHHRAFHRRPGHSE